MREAIIAICIAMSFGLNASVAKSNSCNSDQELELQIYKSRLDDVGRAFNSCRLALSEPVSIAEQTYAKKYYEQEAGVRDAEVAAYRWQIIAASWILGLVYFLTVAGVLFCGYQLWRSARLSKLPQTAVEMELSLSKLKLQTSAIGVVVLFISYAFLLVFTREIYQIRFIEVPRPAIQTSVAPSGAASAGR